MGSLSIWHWLILLLLFGMPIGMYFVIASGSRTEITRQQMFLHGSFVAWALSLVAFTGLMATDIDSVAPTLGVLVIVLALAWWSYLISLSLLAKRTGRNWILWAGLTVLTSPIGELVSYLLMIGALRKHQRASSNAA